MTVDKNSVKAFYELQSEFETEEEWVFYCVQNTYKPSSRDIMNVSKLPRNSVCGRLKGLEDKGRIHKAGVKTDPWTKRDVNWYGVGPKPEGKA